jgi:transposase
VCDNEIKIIERLQEEKALLKEENEILKTSIEELEARLAKYENAHAPPSLRRGGNSGKGRKQISGKKPGQKKGHKGITRPQPEPDNEVEVTADRCPYCDTKLDSPFRTESEIIEDIPAPQPVIVTEFKIAHYTCPRCQREIVATHPDCPKEGRFGNNTIARATLLKYEDRLPHRKIRNALKRDYGLKVSPASILDFTRRGSDAIRSEYEQILERIRRATILYVDETGIRVQGKKYWIWIFTTPEDTFVVVRKSRGMKVLMEVLTRRFGGIIVCDGWKPYARFTKRIQRCWAHLLRESKYLAGKFADAVYLHKALVRLYQRLDDALKDDPPPVIRERLWHEALETLMQILGGEYTNEKVNKFIGKIHNGFEYWFTFVLHPGVEPTNNRAERALREHVVQRKIIGTLRNGKGTYIHETVMSVLATWAQRGLNSLEMLRLRLES